MQSELRGCQREMHTWGVGNRVSFDPGKENVHVLHRPQHGLEKTQFKILGVVFDSRLIMATGVETIAQVSIHAPAPPIYIGSAPTASACTVHAIRESEKRLPFGRPQKDRKRPMQRTSCGSSLR